MILRALVVGPSWVGDMVMAQPLLQMLKKQAPTGTIDMLAPAWSGALTRRMPEVSRAIPMPLGHGQLGIKQRYQLARSLRGQYDVAYVLPNAFKAALVPFWANIPRRVGWRGEWRYGVLNDVRPLNKLQYPKMIQRFAALALPKHAPLPSILPVPALTCSQPAIKATQQKFRLSTAHPVAILCPGAEFGPSKQWPAAYFAELAKGLLRHGWQVWLLGSPNDRMMGQAIAEATGHECTNLVGKTELSEAIDLIALADIVVSNDSGLMHIAAALNRRLIAIYGSTDPSFTPPMGTKVSIMQSDQPCQPCFKRQCPLKHHACMQSLSPEAILAEAVRKVVS